MPDPTITTIDLGSPILENARFRDGELTLAGADTMAVGTIIARDTSTLKYVIYAKGGTTDGNGVPRGILTEEIVSTEAEDVPIRPAIAGDFRKERLIIDADGDDSNIDGAVIDLLLSTGIVAIDALELSVLDNGA